MFDLSSSIDLPLLWGGLIALSVLLYVCLDGFDLGIGILFPFAPSDKCRDKMMNSISPFWDGNETWLVLGGGGLLAAFPLAYSVLMPAIYMPLTIMLIALIFRGISFEFRFKASIKTRRVWDYCFHYGSLVATLMQGIILGVFVQGINVVDRKYAGGAWGWLNGFSITVGLAMVFGYALLGSTWVIMKTEEETQSWAKKCSLYVLIYVLGFMGIVSLWVPFLNNQIFDRWFSWPNMFYFSPLPIISVFVSFYLIKTITNGKEVAPFLLSISLFILAYIGLAVSLWPWVVPYSISVWEAAAASESLSLISVGAAILLPVVLIYTAYSYYIFRGKTSHESLY
ncbi:cytochrome d ubiquinol oxidase subunit II [Candidatus Jidaibacter acanthamoebae]|nr:cytochrome d ubiquinol oxidase subunit II [Candidatus Jidaibacter acanthamoeba]